MNCGETGSGKTELAKLECFFIPDTHGIITIEDTSELHLTTLYPQKNVIELKTNAHFTLADAYHSSLRQDPDWIMLSEARGEEIAELMNVRGSGHGILTTLHMKHSDLLVEKIIDMYDPIKRPPENIIANMVHSYFDMCIHLCCDFDAEQTHRYIDEVTIYERNNEKNSHCMIYQMKKGKTKVQKLPKIFGEQLSNVIVERWNDYAEEN